MFSGIVQEFGVIKYLDDGLYEISTNLELSDCVEGSSISCNGVCLTIKKINKGIKHKYTFEVNIGEETIKRSNLSDYISNNKNINLEKSLKIGDEISGHFVYGHIDTITSVKEILKLNNSWEYYFEKNFLQNNKFIVEKGSISINGISLTVANVMDKSFSISVIEHTFKRTNLQFLKVGDKVNIEFDYLARFILKND